MIPPPREERTIQSTADGSLTIFDPILQSHFHSLHGAVGESLHVYIHGSGLPNRLADHQMGSAPIQVLEIGLGTGLNLLLTAGWASSPKHAHPLSPVVHYTAFEPNPLPFEVLHGYYQSITFPEPAPDPPSIKTVIEAISQQHSGPVLPGLSADLRFRPWVCGRQEWDQAQFDLIYFDPFGPGTAPEMWTANRLEELVAGLKPGGCLTSFSVSGATRRILAKLPVRVERPSGFGRKREMLRVVRLADDPASRA